MNGRLKPLERTGDLRLSEAVYERLLDAILTGRLSPGDIISEVSLARELDVSRTPVHDALRQLVKDGMVRQEANRRAIVATFSAEDIYDVFEMRKLLEGEAARKAADRIDRPTLARLRSIAESLEEGRSRRDWLDRWADFDDEFHSAIAKSSGSTRLAADIGRYRQIHRGFNKLGTTVDVLSQALVEHVAILAALEKRDSEEARRAMVGHIAEWQAYFVNHFPSPKGRS